MLKRKSIFNNLRRFYRRFVLSPRRRSLWGGVLLVCALAFLPVPVSAKQNIFNNSSENTRFRITHNIYGGCIFKDYKISGQNYGFGDLVDGVHNCGYRYVNNHISWYDSGLIGASVSNYEDGHLYNQSYQLNGGYNITNSWANAPIDIRKRTYNTLNNIEIYATDKQSSPQTLIKTPLRDGLALFVYRFDGGGVAGTNIDLDFNGSFITFTKSNGDIISGSEARTILDSINDGSIYTCGGMDLNSYLPSEVLNDLGNASNSCWVISWIPTSSDYSLSAYSLKFKPAPGVSYNWRATNTPLESVGSDAPVVLSLDGYYNFIYFGTNYASSYWNDDLKPSNQLFTYDLCSDSDECDEWSLLRANTINAKKASFTQPENFNVNSWNIFSNLSYVFPFLPLFNLFTDSQCVNIPTIASWLHLPTSQYCQWWPESITDQLTPIFTLAVNAIAVSFVIKWLRSSESGGISGGAS